MIVGRGLSRPSKEHNIFGRSLSEDIDSFKLRYFVAPPLSFLTHDAPLSFLRMGGPRSYLPTLTIRPHSSVSQVLNIELQRFSWPAGLMLI